MELKLRSFIKSLFMMVVWMVVSTAILGAATTAFFCLFLVVTSCRSYADAKGFFILTFYAVTGLWFVFAIIDGVAARMVDRFMKGKKIHYAIGQAWLDNDRKHVVWGPGVQVGGRGYWYGKNITHIFK